MGKKLLNILSIALIYCGAVFGAGFVIMVMQKNCCFFHIYYMPVPFVQTMFELKNIYLFTKIIYSKYREKGFGAIEIQ